MNRGSFDIAKMCEPAARHATRLRKGYRGHQGQRIISLAFFFCQTQCPFAMSIMGEQNYLRLSNGSLTADNIEPLNDRSAVG
jgi:hypothetical protein